jgi:putative membrane protein
MKEYMTAFPEILMKPPTGRVKVMTNGPGRSTEEVPDFVCPGNAPGEITYYLGEYLDRINDKEMVDTNVMKILQECKLHRRSVVERCLKFGFHFIAVSALGDYLCSFEKILRTPMPLAYSRHLEHCLHIYILALPFQLVHELLWLTVPVVIVACFAILGILGIGAEIENPFGYDDNDLVSGACAVKTWI